MTVMQQDVQPHETRPCHCSPWTTQSVLTTPSESRQRLGRQRLQGVCRWPPHEYIIWPVTLPEQECLHAAQ